MIDKYSIYKERLYDLREENDLKLRDIDKILNFKEDSYGQFELEKTILPIIHLNTLANYFNVSLDYIFKFSDKRNYSEGKAEIDMILSGTRLKETRKALKLTQHNLADILHISNSALCEYEKGHLVIPTHVLFEYCQKYKISADYLLGKTDEPKNLK